MRLLVLVSLVLLAAGREPGRFLARAICYACLKG